MFCATGTSCRLITTRIGTAITSTVCVAQPLNREHAWPQVNQGSANFAFAATGLKRLKIFATSMAGELRATVFVLVSRNGPHLIPIHEIA